MPDRKEEYYRKLEFFGRFTASISHELNNVFTIINELNGMLEDLIEMAGEGDGISLEKLDSLQQRIYKQLKRGNSIIKKMNRFAHTIDDPIAAFDPDILTNNFASIYRRLASLRNIDIETKEGDSKLQIESSPFDIQFIYYQCLNKMMEKLPENSAITLSSESIDDFVRVAISSESAETGLDEESLERVRETATPLDIKINSQSNNKMATIYIEIPKKINLS
jgi:signal transduction histidine kinase